VTGSLGSPVATYGPNKITLTAIGGVGLFFGSLVWPLLQDSTARGAGLGVAVVLLGPVVLALAWLLKRRITLCQEGIRYQGLFGEKEMRWEEVERFYYQATKRSVNFIPIGTYYSLKLVDARGQKIALGNGVERPAELGQKLIDATYAPMLRKAASLFDSGAELDFGPIRVSRQDGFKVKKTFGWKEIPWGQLHDYAIQEGHFYLWPVGKKYVTGHALGQIPNAFVLLGLLDIVCRPEQPAREGETA
jgi:hypothetical protein